MNLAKPTRDEKDRFEKESEWLATFISRSHPVHASAEEIQNKLQGKAEESLTERGKTHHNLINIPPPRWFPLLQERKKHRVRGESTRHGQKVRDTKAQELDILIPFLGSIQINSAIESYTNTII